MINKVTQKIPRKELEKVLAVARGDQPADLLIKNVRILDLVNGDITASAIAISGSYIAGIGKEYESQGAVRTIDAQNAVAVPGFIDGHLHIESSMMHPFEFEKITLPRGTTTAICDPHEITNVMGAKGFRWFLRCAEKMHQTLFVQVSSCIPALPGFETNGGQFDLIDMKEFKNHPHVLGLAEMMNFPGVIHGDKDVLDKIEEFEDLNLDGHSPLLQGKALNAYIAAGIQNCHETVTAEEAKEKLSKGMALMIREGSVAKNVAGLAPVVTEFNSPQCLLCTDDRNPHEIHTEGHIDHIIRKMINDVKMPVHVAYRLSSFSAAKHFGLKRMGLIAPGKVADIVLLKDLVKVDIQQVFSKGQPVEELNLNDSVAEKLNASEPPIENTVKRSPLKVSDFQIPLNDGSTYNVIGIVKDQIITEHLKLRYPFEKPDVRYIAVIERHGQGLRPSLGLVHGLGLQQGAIASTVAHDSHNIVVIGSHPEDMCTAANKLIEMGGGLAVVENNALLESMALPIAGLLSLEPAHKIEESIVSLRKATQKVGIAIAEPFIQMAFLALPVIPSLKITDKGLVDVTKFQFVELEEK